MTYLVTIYGKYPSLNEWRSHWWIKRKWKGLVSAAIAAAGIPRGGRKAHLVIRYYFATQQKHDKDNYTPKLILDSFVECGVVPDDSPEYITWELACRDPEHLGFVGEVYATEEVARYKCPACGRVRGRRGCKRCGVKPADFIKQLRTVKHREKVEILVELEGGDGK